MACETVSAAHDTYGAMQVLKVGERIALCMSKWAASLVVMLVAGLSTA